MNDRIETVKLVFDARLFELLSKDLYKDNRSFLRELIQNSADANARHIHWEFKEEERTITEMEDGKGMNYQFVKEDWKKVGKSFKSGNEIGFYGIGRLSVWLVAKKCYIRTNNVEIFWDSISEYKIKQTPDFHNGFLFKIYLKDGINLDEYDINRYIKMNINIPNIKITVNDELITPKSEGYKFKIEMPSDSATVWLKIPEGSYTHLNVFERGLKVSSRYATNLECLIDFNKTVKTLSRESLTISEETIERIILKACVRLAKRYSEDLDKIKDFDKTFSHLAQKYKSKELAELIPIKSDWYLKQLRDFKTFYYSQPSSLITKAKDKGYNILMVLGHAMEKCCELVGLKSIEELREELKEIYFHKKTDTERGKRILEESANYLEFLANLTKDLSMKAKKEGSAFGKVFKTVNVSELEDLIKHNNEAESSFEVIEEEGSESIKYAFGSIAFGEKDNELTVAWQYNDKTVLNLRNELVKTLIRTERLDLIEETLAHEFVHRLGFYSHDEEFMKTYNAIRTEILKRKAENSASFNSKALVSTINHKYKQSSLKIPKKAIEKLLINKGTELKVTIESYGEQEQEET